VAQELLTTSEEELSELTLKPGTVGIVTGGVIVYKNRRFENVPAKKGRRCRKQAAEQAAQDSIWSFMR
jgi:predicted Rdx family selenoprotein